MVKLLCNFCGGKKNPLDVPHDNGFSLHDLLVSSALTRFYGTWGVGLALFTKIVLIPPWYIYTVYLAGPSDEHALLRPLLYFFATMAYAATCLVATSSIHEYHTRYMRKEHVVDMNWREYLSNGSTCAFLFETLMVAVFPMVIYFDDKFIAPQLVIGLLLTLFNVFVLYNYHYADFLPFFEHHDNLVLYECFEESYEPKKLTILESTSTYITVKNIGRETVKYCFRIKRQVRLPNTLEDYVFHEKTDHKEYYFSPSQTLKIVTAEFNGDLGGKWIRFRKHRVFGPNKGETVTTTIGIRGSRDPFHVRLTQKYETKWANKRRVDQMPRKFPVCVGRKVPKTEVTDLPV